MAAFRMCSRLGVFGGARLRLDYEKKRKGNNGQRENTGVVWRVLFLHVRATLEIMTQGHRVDCFRFVSWRHIFGL